MTKKFNENDKDFMAAPFQQLINMNDNFLKLQNEFITAIHELSNKLNQLNLTDNELRKDLETTLANTFSIFNRLREHPNKEILSEVKKIREMTNSFNHSYPGMGSSIAKIEGFSKDTNEKIKELGNEKKFMNKVIWIAMAVLTLIGGFFAFWQKMNINSYCREIKEIHQILKK